MTEGRFFCPVSGQKNRPSVFLLPGQCLAHVVAKDYTTGVGEAVHGVGIGCAPRRALHTADWKRLPGKL